MVTPETEKNQYGYDGSGGHAGQETEAMGTGRNGRRWTRFSSASVLGSIVGNDAVTKGRERRVGCVSGSGSGGGIKYLGSNMKRRESKYVSFWG